MNRLLERGQAALVALVLRQEEAEAAHSILRIAVTSVAIEDTMLEIAQDSSEEVAGML